MLEIAALFTIMATIMEAKEAIAVVLDRCSHRLDELAKVTFGHLLVQADGSVAISVEARATLDARYAEVIAETLAGPPNSSVRQSAQALLDILALSAAIRSQPELFKRELALAVMTRTQQGQHIFAMAEP